MNVLSPSLPFTKEDWMGFAGAEPWANGDEPVAREVGDRYVVADPRRAEFTDEQGNPAYSRRLPFASQAEAMAFLDGLPADFDPAAFGFAPF
jgi:hypothetical protein